MNTENEVKKVLSLKSLRARQLNGKLGGVKTFEGKIVSSKNSVKHGILSNYITEYDYVELKHLEESLVDEYNVQTIHQQLILEQILICYVKLSRCSRLEQEAIKQSLDTQIVKGFDYKALSLGDKVIVPPESVAKLSSSLFENMQLILTRYEPQLVSRLLTLLKYLKELKEDYSDNGI